jgi:formylglycine-generating enzyme required for sulfatase activity
MFRIVLSTVVALLAFIDGAAIAQTQGAAQRRALVIGNDSYQHVERLKNSRADARAVATALEQSGFRVSVHTDLDLNGLKGVLRTFKAQVNGGDEALFFFAGHGVEIDGVSYLMPTDIKGDTPDQVRDDAVPLQRVLDDLREKRARFSLAIIDACRNNPFQGSGRSIGGGRGLAAPPVATGQMVLYSAGAGQIALDELGPRDPVRNGVFTRVLLREMTKPGVEVGEVMRSVREEVAALAKSVGREQVPALYDQRLGQFFFRAPVAAAPQAQPPVAQPPVQAIAAPAGPEVENQFWADAKAINNRAAYEAYLAAYPRGRYAALARAAIAQAAAPAPIPAPAQASTPPPPAATTRASVSAPGTVFKDCDECPEMVMIPGGRFEMGAAPGEEEAEGLPGQFRNRSQPRRMVEVGPFAAGRFEVTRGQYRAFVQATGREDKGCWAWNGKELAQDAGKSWRDPGYAQDDGHPVACVSWDDAKAYTVWLSRRTGKTYRLLTEAEWEYAARAGTVTRRYWGDDGNRSCAYANTLDRTAKRVVPGFSHFQSAECDDGHAYTAPVGRYQANAFGLHDMLGNVWEWVEDCWNETYSGAPVDGRAWSSGNCGRRVLRGGSWGSDPRLVRAADRDGDTTAIRIDIIGFRVARTDNNGIPSPSPSLNSNKPWYQR